MLTGTRPDTNGVDYPYPHSFITDFVEKHPTLPNWFDDHGYTATIGGKIHHQAAHRIETLDGGHLPRKRTRGGWRDYLLDESIGDPDTGDDDAIFEKADVPDEAYRDGHIASEAIKAIENHDQAGDPFFLGVGFVKPHLPFNAPAKYWDLYDPDEIPGPTATDGPADVSTRLWRTLELQGYRGEYGNPDNPVPADLAKQMRHGYYACVSYIDAQVGRLLDALDRTGQRENTLIVFWSDHGFHLGDNGRWGKHVNYELATHVPLIFSGPGVPAGQRTDALVEYVDLYPTLCELTGTPTPDFVEGDSLVPLLNDPDLPGDVAAFSQFPRAGHEGFSARTDRYRYVEWRPRDRASIVARELYDHETDPAESRNLASQLPDEVRRHATLIARRFDLPSTG
jgi:iduronate 2-sulfatase